MRREPCRGRRRVCVRNFRRLRAQGLRRSWGSWTRWLQRSDDIQWRQCEPVKFDPVLRSANETLLHLAALESLGIAFLPKWRIGRDLADGRLEQVLPGTNSFAGRLFTLYPSRKFLSAKVRTFLDFISQDPRLK